jgi:hypothetical protein
LNEARMKEFANAVLVECHKRDPSVSVAVGATPLTAHTGEYMLEISYRGNREHYAFNPTNGTWVMVYQQR